jgi:hypothetical protein
MVLMLVQLPIFMTFSTALPTDLDPNTGARAEKIVNRGNFKLVMRILPSIAGILKPSRPLMHHYERTHWLESIGDIHLPDPDFGPIAVGMDVISKPRRQTPNRCRSAGDRHGDVLVSRLFWFKFHR